MSNLSGEVRRLLIEGPTTVKDIATELSLTERRAQLTISALIQNNQVRRLGKVPNPDYRRRQQRGGHAPFVKLYGLTPHGSYLYKRKET